MTPDERLMYRIKTTWGSVISDAVAKSSLPASFLAAIIADESGGNANATRFEPLVAARLKEKFPNWTPERVTANASSWGLTQIMGENYPDDPAEMADPKTNLSFAVIMLSEFAQRFNLNLAADFPELFHCWNTGEPYDPPHTDDPNYLANGMARMQIYQSL